MPPAETVLTAPVGPLRVAGRWFVDETGRVVMLRGGNTGNSDDSLASRGWTSEKDAAFYRYMGWNTMRVGVQFRMLMPTPGNIDPTYLKQIRDDVELFTTAGFYVTVDFHQDLFSRCDGFPAWAAFTDDQPEGVIAHPVSYWLSPAVQREFDNFWADRKVTLVAPNPDAGERRGLQELYIDALEAVSQMLRDNPRVVGIDTFNEPHPGSQCNSPYADGDASFPGHPVPASAYTDGHTARDLHLAGEDYVDGLVVPAGTSAQEFKRFLLTRFMTKVVRRLIPASDHHVIFSEPMMLDVALALPIIAPNDAPDGRRAVALHPYAITPTNSMNPFAGEPGVELDMMAAAMDRIADFERANPGTAVLASEFGAFQNMNLLLAAVEHFDRALLSWQHWSWRVSVDPLESHDQLGLTFETLTDRSLVPDDVPEAGDPNPQAPVVGSDPVRFADNGTEDPPYASPECTVNTVRIGVRNALGRAYPQVTAGTPLTLSVDRSDQHLRFEYATTGPTGKRFDGNDCTVISVPPFHYPEGYTVAATGARVVSAPHAPELVLMNDPSASSVVVDVRRGS